MKIIAHRGMWFNKNEQNTLVAFERALKNGFGIETDFRDFNGSLVINHDLPQENSLKASIFFDLCNQYSSAGPHAINVKSDGLQMLLAQYLQIWCFEKYFIFDMSIPDTIGYLKSGLNVYSRVSEYEKFQNFDGKTAGIWLDAFEREWYSADDINSYHFADQSIAIVSPELHGRDYKSVWAMIKEIKIPQMNIMLCTDLPLEAQEYFDE
jgi:hypothetical protein